jgi:hypothetical protein
MWRMSSIVRLTDAADSVRGVLRRPAMCGFQPRVDPFRLQPNRPSSTDARVTQLATLAGSVDRVTADAGVLCTFRYR